MFRNDAHGVPAGRVQLLRSLPMFRDCSDEELARVDSLTYATTLPAGMKLTRQGTVGRQAFIVLSGEAVVEISGETVGRATPGDLVGEISLLDRRPQTATVTAQGPMHVLVMDTREFGTWASDPCVVRWLAGEGDHGRGVQVSHEALAPGPGAAKPLRMPA